MLLCITRLFFFTTPIFSLNIQSIWRDVLPTLMATSRFRLKCLNSIFSFLEDWLQTSAINSLSSKSYVTKVHNSSTNIQRIISPFYNFFISEDIYFKLQIYTYVFLITNPFLYYHIITYLSLLLLLTSLVRNAITIDVTSCLPISAFSINDIFHCT